MKKKVFLVALHAKNAEQVTLEAKKILTHDGADGLIVVNNGGYVSSTEEYPNLFDIAVAIKDKYPSHIVGINPLDLSILQAVEAMEKIHIQYWENGTRDKKKLILDLLWTDDSGIIELQGSACIASKLREAIMASKINGTLVPHYASIAFKYRQQPQDLAVVAQAAAAEFPVVVTSGDGTGMAADVEKIKRIRSYIGPETKLALASGLTLENFCTYASYIDICIVGTSLLEDPSDQYVYNKEKIEAFRAEIEKY